MKILSRILSLLVIASLGLAYVGCGGKDKGEDDVEKTQLAKLAAVWTVSSVTLDGAPRTDFPGLTLTISGTFDSTNPKGPYNYSFTGTRPNPSPWPVNGQWSFGANTLTQLVRHDNPDLDMSYELTDSQLTISFNYTGEGFTGSRVSQVKGNWTFVFTK